MKQLDAKFTFTVPETSPVEAERGQKQEKTFSYQQCETEAEALGVIETKKWSIVSLVNDNLKANARANAYQASLAPHKASEVAPEDIFERMVRDAIRLGIPEELARAQFASMKAATPAAPVAAE